jgi:hypothetical protein
MGDGGYFWRNGADLREPEQLAALYYDGENETLIIRAKYEGEAYDFAWIIPVPSVPEVEAVGNAALERGGPRTLLIELGNLTMFRENKRAIRGFQTQPTVISAAPSTGVEVIERKRVGVLDIAVLRSAETEPLLDWLTFRHFALPDDAGEVLEHYVSENWVLVACRVARYDLSEDAARGLRKGTLQPLKLRFRTATPIYPLVMSSLNSGETELLLYALSDSPLVPTDPHSSGLSLQHSLCGFQQLGAGVVDPEFGTYARVDSSEAPLTWQAVEPRTDGVYVCKYRAKLQASEIANDIALESFDPVSYWRSVSDTAASRERQAMAAWVLSWHHPEFLPVLVGSADPLKRGAAAYSTRATPGMLRALVSDPSDDVRWLVASNTRTPEDLLARLTGDPSVFVRVAVAGNPSASEDVLIALAGDRKSQVRERVSENPAAGERVWDVWVNSEDRSARIKAATYQNAPPAAIERLAADEDVEVRKRVARRTDISSELRMKLAHDPSPLVREALVRSCTRDEGDILTFLAADSDESVREAVAWYWLTPKETLTRLAYDPSPGVRSKVAMNRVTPKETVVSLASDPDENVRSKVYQGLRVRGFTPDEAEAMTGFSPR